jgi:mannose-6-phosphate isomerase
MFVGITNTPRDYAWGAPGAISELLGAEPTSTPEAELWLGAHPGSPSRVVGSDDTLIDVVDGRLPFLLKVLAAGSPLSLQAHPTSEQAAAGFARENAAGIPLDAPHRNYKDASAKPELIYALSDTFDALCGFRQVAAVRATIGRLIELDSDSSTPHAAPLYGWLKRMGGDDSLRDVFEWLIARGEGVDVLVARVVELARENMAEFANVVTLAEAYPGDPGIVISLMLHNVTLTRGEGLFLPAGNIHAYLRGVGIELMVSSDNVLRGGLTPKHVDIAELMSVLDFSPVPVPYLRSVTTKGAELFAPSGTPLTLAHVTGESTLRPTGPAVVLCVAGEFAVRGQVSSIRLTRGQAALVTAEEGSLALEGQGDLFVASTAIEVGSA